MTQKQEQQIQFSIRLPESFVDRLDKIAEGMSKPGFAMTRVEALRMLAFRGAEEIEAEGPNGASASGARKKR